MVFEIAETKMRALNGSPILAALFVVLALPCLAGEEPPVPPVQKGDQVITHIVGVKDLVGSFNYIQPTTPAVHVKPSLRPVAWASCSVYSAW